MPTVCQPTLLLRGVLFILTLWSGLCLAEAGSEMGKRPPGPKITTDSTGDLVSWLAQPPDRGPMEYVADEKKLLIFQLFDGTRDVSDEILWRESDSV